MKNFPTAFVVGFVVAFFPVFIAAVAPLARWARVGAAVSALRAAVGLDDLVLVLALVLLSVGVGMVWIPGGFIVPGVVLLWLVLPSRAPFVTGLPAPKKPTAPDAPISRRSA